MKLITDKVRQDYLDDPNHCPLCKSEDISAESFEPEGSYIHVRCNICGTEWYEVLDIINIEIIKTT